jgi:hypothetical protein
MALPSYTPIRTRLVPQLAGLDDDTLFDRLMLLTVLAHGATAHLTRYREVLDALAAAFPEDITAIRVTSETLAAHWRAVGLAEPAACVAVNQQLWAELYQRPYPHRSA